MSAGDASLGTPAVPARDTAGNHRRADAAPPGVPAADPLLTVRGADLEPYTGLRYLSKLFRLIAILLIDVGHDVRAARILLARATAHAPTHPPTAPPRDGAPSAPSAPPDASVR